MNKILIGFFSLITVLATTVAQANPQQQNTVTFDKPEKFTDFRIPNRSAKRSRIDLMEDIERDVSQSLAKLLPAGSRMQIEFTNVDMAGWIDPFSQPDQIRLIRNHDKSELNFNFRWLSTDGSLLKQDSVRLIDHNLLSMRSRHGRYSSTRLPYEMAMFDNWLRKLVKQ